MPTLALIREWDVPMHRTSARLKARPCRLPHLAGPNHILRYVNPAFCRLADKTKDDLIGKPFAEVVFWEGCLALLDRVFATRQKP